MKIGKIVDGKIQISNIYILFPNTSFPDSGPPDSFIQENELYKVEEIPQHDEQKQKIVMLSEPIIKNNLVYTFEIIEKSEEEINYVKWLKVRELRNKLLSESDLNVVSDKWHSYTDKNAWINYRQILRNIPQQFMNPDNIAWPEKPGVNNNVITTNLI